MGLKGQELCPKCDSRHWAGPQNCRPRKTDYDKLDKIAFTCLAIGVTILTVGMIVGYILCACGII